MRIYKYFLSLSLGALSLLTGCWSASLPPKPPEPLPSVPTLRFVCDDRTGAKLTLSSHTKIFVPLITVPRFPDGSVPIRYQLENFVYVSEQLALSWCPPSAKLEYSHSENGARLSTEWLKLSTIKN